MTIPFFTVGGLREALDGLPDDRMILGQVVAADGTAWTMHAELAPDVRGGSSALLIISHPQLKSLSPTVEIVS